MGGFSAGFYGMLRFNAFSYLDIVDTRLQETPDSEYPICKVDLPQCINVARGRGLSVVSIGTVHIGIGMRTRIWYILYSTYRVHTRYKV